MSLLEMTITPQRGALIEGQANILHALVRVSAPDAPAVKFKRIPLNIALVIDRSGSMNGTPLYEACRCAQFIIDNMNKEDRASLVVYDNEVDVLVPSQRVADKAQFKQALASIESRGMTALFDGWQQGADQAMVGVDSQALSRVLLLSDGCANEGLTDPEEIANWCARLADQGVSTSTYGVSHHFNEQLMVDMAKAGQGQSYYGESAEDLMDPFREEFELLSSLCARKLRLHIEAEPGVKCEVLNDYRPSGENCYQLPDLAYGAEGWALLRLTIPAELVAQCGRDGFPLINAALEAEDMEQVPLPTLSAGLSVPALSEKAWQCVAEDEQVLARLQEIRAAQLQREARLAAEQEDWPQVDTLMRRVSDEAEGNPWLKGSLSALKRYARRRQRSQFSKEAMYKSSRMSTRLAEKGEGLAYSAADESVKPAFLRRKREQGKKMEPEQ